MWQEFLASIKLDQVALAGIVTYIIYAILTGRLYSRAAVDEIRGERDDWKTAFFKSDQANHILTDQVSDLIDANRTSQKVISSLPHVGGDPS